MVNYQANISLIIDGEPFPYWENVSIKRQIKGVSTLEATIPNRFGQFTSRFAKNSIVQFFATWGLTTQAFWTGKIDSITRSADRHGSLSIWCRDPLRIFEREQTVDNNFIPYPDYSGTYQSIMQYMNSQLSIPIDLASSASSTDFVVVRTFGFNNTLKEFTDAAQFGGYEWFYSGLQEKLIIREPRELIETNRVRTFILGDPADFSELDLAGYASLTSDSVQEDFSDEATRVRADGPNGSGIFAVWPGSPPSDLRERNIQSDDWVTTEAALQAAQNFYNEKRFGRLSVDIGILHGQEGIEVGDVILCDDKFYGLSILINKLFRIISITDNFSKTSWESQFQLGDFTLNLTDFL